MPDDVQSPPPAAPAAKSAKATTTLTKEQRSQVAKDAATRRWANAKKLAAKAARGPAKPAPAKKRPTAPREFSSALKTAEKRLAKAILERAEAAAKYAVLSAEIPSLQRIIQALGDPSGAVPQTYYAGTTFPMQPPTLEQIVGDQPLPYQNPPRPQMAPPQVPVIPVPQPLHPANTPQRGGGGAVGGVDLEAAEDEDAFLRESEVAGGQWH